MKSSFYNIIQKKGDVYLLYNCLYEKIMILRPELFALLEDHKNDINAIESIHPTLYSYLLEDKFIVKDNANESADFIQTLIESDTIYNSFRLIINPTLDCNLRCWYCYEKHLSKSCMSVDIIKNVHSLLNNLITSQNIKYLYLSFFGGEPFMKYQSIVHPLIQYTKEECSRHDIKLSCDFTTNAVLLSPKIIDQLASENLDIKFQVPFDGNMKFHDLTKTLHNGKGTYQSILKNIKYGLGKKMSFTIRGNYTAENIESFKELIDEFIDFNQTGQIQFALQKVWQEEKNQLLLDEEKKLRHYIQEKGFTQKASYAYRNQCYADRENCIVVNYNGDIFKCTANDFNIENREGILTESGHIKYNSQHNDRLKVKYELDTCLKCKILPICIVCTQHKLKQIKENGAFSECSQEEKDEMIRDRIHLLMED